MARVLGIHVAQEARRLVSGDLPLWQIQAPGSGSECRMLVPVRNVSIVVLFDSSRRVLFSPLAPFVGRLGGDCRKQNTYH